MSGINPYINSYAPAPTCPSQRFCQNHKYNTGGLFSGFYNENSSLHCGQQHIQLPKFEKMNGGSALPGTTCINVSPGEQLVANNGKEYTDVHINSNLASMRTGFVAPGTESMINPSLSIAQSRSPKKEGFANTTNPAFTSDPLGIRGPLMTSSTAVTGLPDNVCGRKKRSATEKFCSACTSPCGCTILGIIVAILAVVLLMKFANCWSHDRTGRKIFNGGVKYGFGEQYGGSGNMNLTGGKCGDREEDAAEIEEGFSII
jgi:hypothetical protein